MRRRLKSGGSPGKGHRRKSRTQKVRIGPKAERGRSAPTEARRLERSLRESEERYALVSEAVAEGVYDWNVKLNSLFVSSRLMEIFGFEGARLTSEDWNRRVHPDDTEIYRSALRDCFKQNTSKLECQYRIKAADGNYRWVEDHGLPIRNEASWVVRLVGAVSDISRRQQTEQALRDSEQRYALAMQAVNEGVYDWNIATGEMYYSPRVRDAVGLTPDELGSPKDWLDRIHPDDLPAYKQAFAAHLKGETDRLTCEIRYRHPDGTWHWVRQHGLALRDQAGRAYRMAGSTGDITAEKNVAMERDVFLQELNAVLDTIDYGVLFMGPDLRAKIINRAFRKMWGISDEFIRTTRPTMADLINYNRNNDLYDVAPDEFDNYVARRVEAVRAGAAAMSEILRRDGRMLTYFDITDIKRGEEQARTLLIELRQRTSDLTEALVQQTAMADVLRVISRSPGELEQVFQAILENATRICQAQFGTLNLYDGSAFRTVALHNPPPQYAFRLGVVIRPHPESGLAHVARTTQIAHIDDIRTRQPYLEGNKAVVDLADLAGARTLLIVPMLNADKAVGAISIYRQEVRPFTEKHIELLTSFAAQAVIAIENARLLNELRQRTDDLTESLEQQMATSEVLQVISKSQKAVQPVLDAVVESAARLCEALSASIYLRDGDVVVPYAHSGPLGRQPNTSFLSAASGSSVLRTVWAISSRETSRSSC
jgi:PAS domain S-box-containing protein